MNIHLQIVVLHIWHIVGAARLKAVVHAHVVDVVAVRGAWHTVDSKGDAFGQPPLPDSHRFVNGVVAQRLQVVGQIAAVIPFSEKFGGYRVGACHIGVGNVD